MSQNDSIEEKAAALEDRFTLKELQKICRSRKMKYGNFKRKELAVALIKDGYEESENSSSSSDDDDYVPVQSDENQNHNHHQNENNMEISDANSSSSSDDDDYVQDNPESDPEYNEATEEDDEEVDKIHFGIDIYQKGMNMKHHRFRHLIKKNQDKLDILQDKTKEEILDTMEENGAILTSKDKEEAFATIRVISGPNRPVVLSTIPVRDEAKRYQWIKNQQSMNEERVHNTVGQYEGAAVMAMVDVKAISSGKQRKQRIGYLGKFVEASQERKDKLSEALNTFINGFVEDAKKRQENNDAEEDLSLMHNIDDSDNEIVDDNDDESSSD